MSDLAHCLAILKALQVREIHYALSGGGDSGTATLSRSSMPTGAPDLCQPSPSASPMRRHRLSRRTARGPCRRYSRRRLDQQRRRLRHRHSLSPGK